MRQRRNLNEHLELEMCKGAEEFIGHQVEGEWERVAVPHHELLNQTAQLLPNYLYLVPNVHEPKLTLMWAKKKVHVQEHVDFKTVPSKSPGYVTLQPHNVTAVKGTGSKTSEFEAATDNFPQVALRLSDQSIVAEDPNHPVAIAMAHNFDFLRDKLWHRDLVAFVGNVLYRLGGIKRLKAASSWFVPWTKESAYVIPKLAQIIRSFEQYSEIGMCDLYIPKMPRAETEHVRGATKSAQRKFTSEYRDIFNEIESFIGNMVSGDVVRDSTLKERLKLSRFLRDRAELYQEILDLRTDNMRKALDVIGEATEVLIDGAGEYRAAVKDIKKIEDEKQREQEKAAAQKELEKWGAEAEKVMKKCRGILDPGTDQDVDEAA